MVRDMDGRDDVQIHTFLANGLNWIYIQEWNVLYIRIVTYVNPMYVKIINQMNGGE